MTKSRTTLRSTTLRRWLGMGISNRSSYYLRSDSGELQRLHDPYDDGRNDLGNGLVRVTVETSNGGTISRTLPQDTTVYRS